MESSSQGPQGSATSLSNEQQQRPPVQSQHDQQPFIVQLTPSPDRGKTWWDWLQLIISIVGALGIPLAVLLGSAYFSDRQNSNNLQIAKDQQQQTALDTYIDRMSDLMVLNNKDTLQDSTSTNFEVRRVARARTLIVLTILDPERKRFVVQFLFDTKLIKNNNPVKTDNPIVRLDFAHLDEADLSGMYLENVDFFDLYMTGANLHYAYLKNSELSKSYLQHSDLSYANLQGADLQIDDLQAVNFSNTDLRGANLRSAYILGPDGRTRTLVSTSWLEQQTSLLHGTTMPDGSIHP